jgi:hypothetical protein
MADFIDFIGDNKRKQVILRMVGVTGSSPVVGTIFSLWPQGVIFLFRVCHDWRGGEGGADLADKPSLRSHRSNAYYFLKNAPLFLDHIPLTAVAA